MEGKDFSSPDIRDIDRATPREETARNIQERRWRASISGLAAHFLDVRWCISLFCNEFLSLSLSPDACICTLYVCTLLTSAFLTFSFSYKAPIRGHLRGACTDLLLLFPLSPHSSSSSSSLSLSLSPSFDAGAFRIWGFSLVSSNCIYIYTVSRYFVARNR